MGARPPLLERDPQLAVLVQRIAEAGAARGSVTFVHGDPGTGRSALLAAARERAEAVGMPVLAARGSELERDFAFGVAVQLLGERGAAVLRAHWAPDRDATELTLLAVYDELLAVAAAAGALVIVDDMHGADDQSLRLLAHAALHAPQQPLAIVLADPPARLAGELRGAHRLELGALSAGSVAVLARRVLGGEPDPGLVAACAAATAGNAASAHELLIELAAESAPPTPAVVERLALPIVRRRLASALDRVGPTAAELADAVAILGDDVPLRLAAALSEVDGEEAERCADALAHVGVLAGGEPLRFVHPLAARALTTTMAAFARAAAHRRAAALLAADGAPTARLATHLFRTRPSGDAHVVDVLAKAADAAIAAGDPAFATALVRRALEEPAPAERRPALTVALAKAQAATGLGDAGSELEAALEAVVTSEHGGEVLAELATLAHHRGDYRRAVALTQRARSELALEDRERERMLAIELGAAAFVPALRDHVVAEFDRLAAGPAPAQPRLQAMRIAWLATSAPAAQVRELAEALIAHDPLIDDSHGLAAGWVGAALMWVDELDVAQRWLDGAIATADRRGDVAAANGLALQRAVVRHHGGRLDGAIADAKRSLRLYDNGWTRFPWGASALATSEVARGELDGALSALELGASAGEATPDRAFLLEAEAQVHLAVGDAEAALQTAQAATEEFERRFGALRPRVSAARRLAALAAHQLGRHDDAQALIDADLAMLRTIGPARQLAAALTTAGVVAGGGEGLTLLQEATSLLVNSPARLQRAETLLELGSALRRGGERTASKEPLYSALDLAAQCGARPLEQRARGELASLGLRPRRTARTGVASLTPGERRVAELAARGRSTPQIARDLQITRNTVETHLAHIYRKLDLRGRGALAEALSASSENER